MFRVLPSIDPAIASLAPGFRARSISVEATRIVDPNVGAKALVRACQALTANDSGWKETHLSSWAELFRRFGAKPQRTPCSADALRKRAMRDGSVPGVNPVVDLYNAVSIEYAVPVGGENFAAYIGMPRLVIANGTEHFDTVKDGAPVHEMVDAGEVVWRDDHGATCRRWNWRQGTRTRLDSDAKQMWFILESLPAMPLEALHEAGARLTDGLNLMMPGAMIDSRLIGFGSD
ncbi:DNA/RNA-binding domain of Phe-tRNA-synthetase-like protein [Paraburkholderia sp. RAU2J]|uniref:B3/B4 domain-containing protein n=1 Tax=Paraburkholderia sp. RAU2J TaxID=1938810 RepID=UPI000EAD7DE2|nr:B3/4 domain-containing protein [Paraburkholderia sp. RAU2J]RKT10768.1 DNA/RNA-binding domain of Phe-tRNA-synthetase-like protein [Paraburkholderia sp. RAU2J]